MADDRSKELEQRLIGRQRSRIYKFYAAVREKRMGVEEALREIDKFTKGITEPSVLEYKAEAIRRLEEMRKDGK